MDINFQLLWVNTLECDWWIKSHIRFRFNFVRNCQTIFWSARTILHPHWQWMSIPVVPHPCQNLVLSVFCTFAVLIDVLVCNSLVTYSVDHLFICLFTSSMYLLLWGICSGLLPITGLWVFFWHFKCSLYTKFWVQILYQICFLQIFSICGLPFYSLNSVFCSTKVFNLMKSTYQVFLSSNMLLVLNLKTFCQIQGHIDFLLCYLREFS